MDISKAILAKSDQLNAVDLIEPVTVTIVAVHPGEDDKEARIVTDAFGEGRPYIPPKTVLRIIGGAWGKNTQPWIGRRMTIYNLPSVRYGGEVRGGVRISALSNISGPISYAPPAADGLGKGAKLTVQPLPDAAPTPDGGAVGAALDDIERATSMGELKTAWDLAAEGGVQRHPDVVAAKDAKKAELGGGTS